MGLLHGVTCPRGQVVVTGAGLNSETPPGRAGKQNYSWQENEAAPGLGREQRHGGEVHALLLPCWLGHPPCFRCKPCSDQGGTLWPSIRAPAGLSCGSGVPSTRPKEIWVPKETGEGHVSVL